MRLESKMDKGIIPFSRVGISRNGRGDSGGVI